MTANRYEFHNLTSLNQQAAAILKDYRIPFAPKDELAALVLVRSAIERGQIEIPTLPEPLLLIAKTHLATHTNHQIPNLLAEH